MYQYKSDKNSMQASIDRDARSESCGRPIAMTLWTVVQ